MSIVEEQGYITNIMSSWECEGNKARRKGPFRDLLGTTRSRDGHDANEPVYISKLKHSYGSSFISLWLHHRQVLPDNRCDTITRGQNKRCNTAIEKQEAQKLPQFFGVNRTHGEHNRSRSCHATKWRHARLWWGRRKAVRRRSHASQNAVCASVGLTITLAIRRSMRPTAETKMVPKTSPSRLASPRRPRGQACRQLLRRTTSRRLLEPCRKPSRREDSSGSTNTEEAHQGVVVAPRAAIVQSALPKPTATEVCKPLSSVSWTRASWNVSMIYSRIMHRNGGDHQGGPSRPRFAAYSPTVKKNGAAGATTASAEVGAPAPTHLAIRHCEAPRQHPYCGPSELLPRLVHRNAVHVLELRQAIGYLPRKEKTRRDG